MTLDELGERLSELNEARENTRRELETILIVTNTLRISRERKIVCCPLRSVCHGSP
jgi:hypothetical protein